MNYVICKNEKCQHAVHLDDLIEGQSFTQFVAGLELTGGHNCPKCGDNIVSANGDAIISHTKQHPSLKQLETYYTNQEDLEEAYKRLQTSNEELTAMYS